MTQPIDLTTHIRTRQRNEYAAAIRKACREIAACPCLQKQWEALRVLRVLQDRMQEGN